MKMYALDCGHLGGRLKDMIEGEEGEIELPISSYLIEHPKGTVLFDTGMHPALQTDPESKVGRLVRIFKFDKYKPGDEIGAKLQSIGRDPGKVDYVVNSHLHFDHSGGNAQLPNATLVIQKKEWEIGRDAERAAQFGFAPEDVNQGHPVRAVEGEHDLFGDGRLVCLPTHGHTPGHQSLKVRLDSGDVVLTGDACYFCRTLTQRRLPRFVHDREAMLASLEKISQLEKGGARIFVGHDPDFWATLPQDGTPIT